MPLWEESLSKESMVVLSGYSNKRSVGEPAEGSLPNPQNTNPNHVNWNFVILRRKKKILVFLLCLLIPILCIGESEAERVAEQTETVLASQLQPVIDEVGIDVGTKIIPFLVEAFGDRFTAPSAFDKVLADGRKGKKNQKGFYEIKQLKEYWSRNEGVNKE